MKDEGDMIVVGEQEASNAGVSKPVEPTATAAEFEQAKAETAPNVQSKPVAAESED